MRASERTERIARNAIEPCEAPCCPGTPSVAGGASKPEAVGVAEREKVVGVAERDIVLVVGARAKVDATGEGSVLLEERKRSSAGAGGWARPMLIGPLRRMPESRELKRARVSLLDLKRSGAGDENILKSALISHKDKASDKLFERG